MKMILAVPGATINLNTCHPVIDVTVRSGSCAEPPDSSELAEAQPFRNRQQKSA
jgi:hypothetical protein